MNVRLIKIVLRVLLGERQGALGTQHPSCEVVVLFFVLLEGFGWGMDSRGARLLVKGGRFLPHFFVLLALWPFCILCVYFDALFCKCF